MTRNDWASINSAIESNEKFVVLDLRQCGASTKTTTIDSSFGDIIYDNEYIKRIILPSTVTSIGRNAFAGCGYLTSVTFGRSETSFICDYDESFPYSASLYLAYSAGGAGTYVRNWSTWTKQK
jgi:hypothetical protein